jgi:hypothetical protein
MYYYFKKLDGNYKLYYLFGETTDELNEYFSEVEDSESSKALSIKRKYDTELNNVYDFSKLSILTNTKLNEIYDNNKNNLVMINSYYNTSINSVANGILINDGLVLTTWSFLNKALLNSQGITIRNSDGIAHNASKAISIRQNNGVLTLKITKNRNGLVGNKLMYNWDINTGVFTYLPNPKANIPGEVNEQIAEENRNQYQDEEEIF